MMGEGKRDNACHWRTFKSIDGYFEPWEADCGFQFELNEGTPAENNMKYCCYCGGELIEAVTYEADEPV